MQNDHVHDWYFSPNFIRDDQIKEDKKSEENNIYVGEEKYLQGFGGETWKEENTWKTYAKMAKY